MKKIITLGIMLLFLGMTISSTTGIYLEKQTIKPISSGNILYVGGNGTGNYSKIQDAIDNARDGCTVFVYDDSSPYYENVIVNKNIYLTGENKSTTIIDGQHFGDVVSIPVDWVHIRGFTIQNSGNRTLDAGMKIQANNITLSDNIIMKNRYGIYGENSSNCTIMDNRILINLFGLSLQYIEGPQGTKVKIIRNNFSYNGLEQIAGYEQSIIENNIFIKGRNGIYLNFSHNNTIQNNTCVSNTYSGIKLHSSNNNVVFNNTLISNNDDGILLSLSSSNTITGNNIRYNRDGICLQYYSSSNTITGNNISRNNMSILLENSNNNTFLKNNFLNNKRHTFFRGCRENTWKQNYWNRPRILPKIIFGRIGEYLLIPWINFDWHPATEPYDIGV